MSSVSTDVWTGSNILDCGITKLLVPTMGYITEARDLSSLYSFFFCAARRIVDQQLLIFLLLSHSHQLQPSFWAHVELVIGCLQGLRGDVRLGDDIKKRQKHNWHGLRSDCLYCNISAKYVQHHLEEVAPSPLQACFQPNIYLQPQVGY